jgi:hypothetical protein
MATIFFALLRSLRPIAVSLIFVLAAAAPVRTQSLVDASKRAEENSKANKAYTPRFTDDSLGGTGETFLTEMLSTQLTLAQLRTWAGAVKEIKKAFAADPALKQRVTSVTDGTINRPLTERTYTREPKIGTILAAAGLNAHEFYRIRMSFAVSLAGMRDRRLAARFNVPGVKLPANIAMLRANETEAAAIEQEVEGFLPKIDSLQ